MSKIKVNLRVVGLFFSRPVEIEYRDDLSIKDIMDAAIAQYPLQGDADKTGIAYRFSTEGPHSKSSVFEITCGFDGTYDEYLPDGTVAKKDGLTIGKKRRKAGIYRLQELVLDPIVVAWQSYVIDKKSFENKTKTLPGAGFTTFDTPLNKVIQDGDTIIWRMVAIVRKPNVDLYEHTVEGKPNSYLSE